MRKNIIITCLALSGLMILDSINFGGTLIMFLMTGDIPGTSFSLPATFMFLAMWLMAGLIILRTGFKSLLKIKPLLKKAK